MHGKRYKKYRMDIGIEFGNQTWVNYAFSASLQYIFLKDL